METAFERGWSTLNNGELLTVAEQEGFEVFVTDKNLRDQQNLGSRRIAIVVLSSTSWLRIQKSVAAVKHAIDTASPGTIEDIDIA